MHVIGVARTDVRVMREATALANAGYTVTIVDMECDTRRPRTEIIEGIRIKHVFIRNMYVATRIKLMYLPRFARILLWGTLRVLSTPADVYHAHDANALPACYVGSWVRRKPLILDAHELPLVQPNLTRWRKLSAISGRFLRGMMRRCTGTITVSPPLAPELQQRYGGPLATIVRNVPVYRPPESSNRLREHLGLPPDTRIALYQGGLQENRNLDVLVRAGKFLLPGTVVVMMGPGPLRRHLESLIADEGVGERIKVLPAVPYEGLFEWTASADISLSVFDPGYSPSIHMCLPNKLFEYLMAGVPVLASRLPAVEDIIQTYQVGRVVEDIRPEAVAQAIDAMLADREGLRRMRANALAASREYLRWDCESGVLTQFYQQILETGVRSQRAHHGV